MPQERYCNIINASDFVLIAKTSLAITEYLEVVTRKSQGHSSHAKKIILVYICQTSYRGSDISRKTYIPTRRYDIHTRYACIVDSVKSNVVSFRIRQTCALPGNCLVHIWYVLDMDVSSHRRCFYTDTSPRHPLGSTETWSNFWIERA